MHAHSVHREVIHVNWVDGFYQFKAAAKPMFGVWWSKASESSNHSGKLRVQIMVGQVVGWAARACLKMCIYNASDIKVCFINGGLLHNGFRRNFMKDCKDLC